MVNGSKVSFVNKRDHPAAGGGLDGFRFRPTVGVLRYACRLYGSNEDPVWEGGEWQRFPISENLKQLANFTTVRYYSILCQAMWFGNWSGFDTSPWQRVFSRPCSASAAVQKLPIWLMHGRTARPRADSDDMFGATCFATWIIAKSQVLRPIFSYLSDPRGSVRRQAEQLQMGGDKCLMLLTTN